MGNVIAADKRSEDVSGLSFATANAPRGYLKEIEGDSAGTSQNEMAAASLQSHLIGSFAGMPITLHVRIPIAGFKIHSLASLHAGTIVSSTWAASEDLPVAAGSVRLAWAEFAIADHKRSVRVTRIS